MTKTSIGTLKLSPVKEESRFVFFNDFITINGKVSKGDSVKIFVDGYQPEFGKNKISGNAPSAKLVVRGQIHRHDGLEGYETVEDLYGHVTNLYKDHFYFDDKK